MNPLKSLQSYLSGYCHFADPAALQPLCYWIVGTYLFESFDSFPYLVITARVKRAGKTRLSELVGFTSNMPFNVAGASASSLFRAIKDDKPTIILDEAESLSSEASSTMRTLLNVGYRKGQSISRATTGGVMQFPTYCPKVFVLIGDVYDTLRDRSIIIEMQRGEPKERFSYEPTKLAGLTIGDMIREWLASDNHAAQIVEFYNTLTLPFLTDRDEEIWRPIFAIAKVLNPLGYPYLFRIATDLAAEKTNPERYRENKSAEDDAQDTEYGRKLLRDMVSLFAHMKTSNPQIYQKHKINFALWSIEIVELLKGIDTAPWRKYKGAGLVPEQAAYLLARFGLRPKLVRRNNKISRGYLQKDIELAAKKEGLL